MKFFATLILLYFGIKGVFVSPQTPFVCLPAVQEQDALRTTPQEMAALKACCEEFDKCTKNIETPKLRELKKQAGSQPLDCTKMFEQCKNGK